MLNISKTARYSLQGLVHLAKNRDKGFIKIEEISKTEDIPQNYLRKIFQQLIRNKVVESGVGPRGGVRLPEKIDLITLGSVIRIFDGEPEFDQCTLFGTKHCPKLKNCPIHQECRTQHKVIWDRLDAFRLEDLLN